MTSKIIDVVGHLVPLLTPLASEERQKAIAAALTILGEAPMKVSSSPDVGGEHLNDKAKLWIKQNSVSDEQIQQVFHIADGSAEIIAAEIPGKSKKEQTFNCYLLVGVARLLAVGNTSFTDKEARDQCQISGCYDGNHHATYMKDKSNDFAGGKEKGWSLTAPGLKNGATLVKEIAGATKP